MIPGMITIEEFEDESMAWTPRNSQALKDYETVQQYYGEQGRPVVVYAELKNTESGNILTMEAYQDLIDFDSYLRAFEDANSELSFES